MARTIAKDYDDKRRLILEHAAEVFASEGFGRASVNQVAQACNISKANIYHYYASKDEILFDILDSYLSDLRDRVFGLDLTGLSAEDQFRKTVTEILLAYKGSDNEHRVQTSGINHLPSEQQAILTGYQRELVGHVGNLVDAMAPDVFDGDQAKLRATTMSVFGMLNWFYMWNSDADADARKYYADLICNMCQRGIPGL